VILLENISKIYNPEKKAVHALCDLSLKIENAEMVAIVGKSGSGKSTLMNILGLMDRPTAGNYYFDEDLVSSFDKDRLAWLRNHKIGFVFQSFNLLPKVNALKNVALPLMYRSDRRDLYEKCMQTLEQVGLQDRWDHLPNELSGGEKQRVATARALVSEPSILLADEPTGNLDSKTSEEVIQLFHDLHKEGQTILIVTHDLEVANQCEREIHLKDGQVFMDKRKSET
jgi:putative ABC transport system ATP-binding protein